MIEIVYTPKDNEKNNDVIRLPKNIKQVGNIKDSRKIYIEDYAINHISETGDKGCENVVGVLLGVTRKSGSDRYIFIKGAINVMDVFVSESEISISDNAWSYIYEIGGKYFPGLDVVGWFVSLDGVNGGMFRTLKKVHTAHFAGGDKVLLIYDRQDNQKNFFVYDNNQLIKQAGYTIYYERNEEMQEYMVDMRNGKRVESAATDFENDRMRVENTMQSFRKISEDNSGNNAHSRKQVFVNYCANVAMVVLLLFVGMYVLDGKEGSENHIPVENQSPQITSVVKVDGNVYPTESTAEVTMANEVTNAQLAAVPQETTQMVAENVMETTAGIVATQNIEQTTAPYITVNNNVTPEIEVTKAAKFVEHEVKKGESLISICKAYYGNVSRVEEIMELNDIKDVDKIYIGQVIKLP